MASALTTIVKAVIEADATKLKKELGKAEKSLKGFADKAGKAGKALTAKVTLPLAGAAAGAIAAASEFEASMTQIQSLVGLSAEAVEGFTDDVKRLSGETARAPKELADAMFFITSAGLRGADAVDALEASAKAAAAGLGETEVVADAVTNALNGYGTEAINAEQATDILVKTVEQGKAAASDLAPQFGRLVPLAAELGVEFDQVGGGLAFLTRSSGDAAMSATQFGGILKTLVKPSQQAEETLTDIGMSVDGLRRMVADEGILPALRNLRSRLEESGGEMSQVFEDSRALTGALQLTGVQAGIAEDVFDELSGSAGKLNEAFGIASNTTKFRLQQAMARFKTVMVDLGEKLIPKVVPLIEKLAGFIGRLAEKFDALSPFMQDVVIALGGIVTAAGPMLLIVAKLSSAVGALAGTKALGGLGGVLAKVAPMLGMSTGGLGFAAAGAAAIIGGGLFMAFKSSKEEAQRAKARQEALTAEYAAQGDAATLLVADTDALLQKYRDLVPVVESTEEAVEGFVGSGVLMSELLKQKVGTAFNDIGIEADVLEAALKGGSDEFAALEGEARRFNTFSDTQMIRSLRNADEEVRAVTSALADQLEQGTINRTELARMLDALDETADAFDDHRAAIASDAEEYLTNTENQQEFVRILGGDVVTAVIEAADKTGGWTDALTDLNQQVEAAIAVEEEHAAAIAAQSAADEERRQKSAVSAETATRVAAEEAEAMAWLAEQEREAAIKASMLEIDTGFLVRAQEEAEEQARLLAEEERRLREEFDKLVASVSSATDVFFDFALQEDNVAAAQRRLFEALTESESGLLGQGEAAEEARAAAARYADEFDDLIGKMVEDQRPVDEIADRFVDLKDDLLSTAEQAGFTADEIGMLTEALDAVPGSISTQVDVAVQRRELEALGGGGPLPPELEHFLNMIPQFADGGIVTGGPVLGLIGEAGPEAVVPLEQMGSVGSRTTNLTVNVAGSILTEAEIGEIVQDQLLRIQTRNETLEFA